MNQNGGNPIDRLDQLLDAVVCGDQPDHDGWMTKTERRLRDLDGAFALPVEMESRIWDELLGVQTPVLTHGSPSGAEPAALQPQSRRDVPGSAPFFQPWEPIARFMRRRRNHGATSRWSLAQTSSIVLLVVVLLIGYGAIRLAGRNDRGAGRLSAPPMVAGTATPSIHIFEPGKEVNADPVYLSIQVDADGLLLGDDGAFHDATRAITSAIAGLSPGCRVGIAIVTGHAKDHASGVKLAFTISVLLQQRSKIFPNVDYGISSSEDGPVGRVDLTLYTFPGCASVGTKTSLPISVTPRPTVTPVQSFEIIDAPTSTAAPSR